MKVAIMTFNRAINYGAVLQSLALKETIKNLGHECEIINYKCSMVERGASPFYIRSFTLKDFAIFILQIRMRMKKNKNFDIFAKRYLDTDKNIVTEADISDISSNYDAFITGSDQVWNYEITGLDKNYFLDFVEADKQRISYAASFGVGKIPEQYKARYRELLRNIDCISVREDKGAEIVETLLGNRCEICIDPVFLFNENQWKKYVKMPEIGKGYILVYSINKSQCYEAAQKLSEKTGLPVVGLQVPMSNRMNIRKIQTESPEEYLGWIYNARYVITDSFHGTAFSIIFKKQFILCTGGNTEGRSSRQKNLLNTVGLTSRICTGNQYLKVLEKIDYSDVNEQLNHEIERSMSFLRNSLQRKE